MRVLYFILMTSLMVMMVFLVAMTAGTQHYGRYVLGMAVTMFCMFGGSVYGYRLMVPVYAIPVAVIILYLVFFESIPSADLSLLSNPVAVAVACIIAAEIQEKMRYREFVSGRIAEIRNRQFDEELALARVIQNSLIPQSAPQTREVVFHSRYIPMIGISGDFFDIIRIDDRHMSVFISDVSGHGVSAALIAGMIKTLINTAGSYIRDPSKLLEYMNEKLIGQTGGHFVTAFYGIYDTSNKIFRYARAGHDYPYLVRRDTLVELKSGGYFMGLMKDFTFEEKSIELEPGDKIVFFTDGITEAMNPDGVMYKDEFAAGLARHRGLEGTEYIETIYRSLELFVGEPSFSDDVCLICMEVPSRPKTG
jgi:sigma-B regulation protein RsbU (phosphoserine phosphatase)